MHACRRAACASSRLTSPRAPAPYAAAELLTSRRRHVADAGRHGSTVDPHETAKFEADADHWWDTQRGPFAPLHAMNPVRCSFIRDVLCRHFGRDARTSEPLAGLRLLDVGCGGGILVEPLARMGADVLGIDAVARSVAVARAHAARDPSVRTRARYRAVLAEELVAEGARFDAVLSLEVVEHVADVPAFTAALAGLVEPRGALLLSTVNRTLRSYALGIVAAERLLSLVPSGTHDWSRFLTADELAATLARSGFELDELAGMVYSPLARRWQLSTDTAVNYIGSWKRSQADSR